MLVHCGRYQLLGEVGSGAMGVVYRARDPNIDRLVAVKVLRQEHAATEASIKRFLKEARAIGRLSHPNIVTVHDMGEEQGNVYFTMELVEGKSLSEILEERRLAMGEAVGIGVQIAKALDYAHRRGVIHQDVKPGNVLLSDDGNIKITDFGIAQFQNLTATVPTRAGEILGTPSYMSPEQIENKTVDGRSDIFSLGVVLYKMVTGDKPFGRAEGTTLAGLLNEILNVTPPAPMALAQAVPKRLSDIIVRALQKDPRQRFQTGGAIAAALKKCLVAPATAGTGAPRATIAKPIVRNSFLAGAAKPDMRNALLAAVVVAVAAIGGIAYFSFREYESGPALPPPVSTFRSSGPPGGPAGPTDTLQRGPQTPGPKSKPVVDTPKTVQPKGEDPKSTPAEKQSRPTTPSRVSKQVQSLAGRTPLTVITTPQGARVYIDSNLIRDSTPLTMMLELGQHHVKATMAGYQDVEIDVNVKETMEYPISFTLQPAAETAR